MHKSVYSLVLSDGLVAELDRAAYQSGLSRSAMVNQILAGYLSYVTPEKRMEEIFAQAQRLLTGGGIFQSLLQPSDSMMSLRTALAYKYNPTVRYSVELFPGAPAQGELRVSLRSQSSGLILSLGQFFRLWDQIERLWAGEVAAVIQEGRYIRRLNLPHGFSHQEQGAVLAGYLEAMEQGLNGFFRHLDQAQVAAAAVEQAYQNYRNQYPLI